MRSWYPAGATPAQALTELPRKRCAPPLAAAERRYDFASLEGLRAVLESEHDLPSGGRAGTELAKSLARLQELAVR